MIDAEPVWGAAIVAALVSVAAVAVMRVVAPRIGAVDQPGEERRVHARATPRLGGVGVLAGILVATVAFVDWSPTFGLARLNIEQLAVLLACAVGICALGAWDDARGLTWRTKLLGQVVLATAAVLVPLAFMERPDVSNLLLVVNQLDLPFLPPVDVPAALSVGLVVLWFVTVMNMLNFTDGIDGLAAGQSAIMAATFAIIAASYLRDTVAVLSAATAGAAIGFLPHNFRRGGARIFLGDSGSMLLGFLLAAITVQGVLKTTAAVALVIPFAMLAVPILDTAFVVAKRRRARTPVVQADRSHLHHRLLNVGLSPRRATVLLCLWTASMSALALGLRFIDYGNSRAWEPRGLLLLGFIALGALLVSVLIAVRLEIIKTRSVRLRNRQRAAELRAARLRGGAPPAGNS